MSLNVPAIERLKAHLIRHPEQYDQKNWVGRNECGTTACAAGWTVLLETPESELAKDMKRCSRSRWCDLPQSSRVPETAQEILGIDEGQSYTLFYTAKTLEHVTAMLDLLVSTSGECSWEEMEIAAGIEDE